jgi:hypothetical protein
MYDGGVASVYDTTCAGDVPLANVPNIGSFGREQAGEVKRVVERPFTFKMAALVCLVCLVYLVEPD